MSYSQDLPLVSVTVSPEFNFFGDASTVLTTVTPVLDGTRAIRRGSWWGNTINGQRPLVQQYQRSFTLPVVEASGWTKTDGTSHGAWTYEVEVYVSATGRSPVLWSGSIAPTSTSPVTLTPADGTVVSEVTVGTTSQVNTDAGGLSLSAGADGVNPVSISTNDLGPLFAGYTLRTAQPVGIVTLGSSTTEGSDQSAADRWVNKLIARMQAAYPSGTGTESAVGTPSTARRATPGIHGYNRGLSGTTSTNYLTDGWVSDIGALQPRVITHMVGSNDYNEQMPIATFKANLTSWMDKLDAACPPPVVHVLIHAHRRGGPVRPITWADYGAALKELAHDRANCVFVDNSEAFESAGVPDTDPLDLLKDDLVHLTPAGHDMTFRLMADHFRVGAPAVAATSATTSATGAVISSDSFSGADAADISGRATDNLLGGSLAKTWVCDPAGNVGTTAGRLVRKTSGAAFFAGIQMDFPDHEIAFTLVAGAANDLMVTVRRALGAVAGAPDDYRFVIGVNGSAILRKRVSGTESQLATLAAGTLTAGSRIAVRAVKDRIQVSHNGALLIDVVDTAIAGPGWVGLSGVGTTTGWEIDNVTISVLP